MNWLSAFSKLFLCLPIFEEILFTKTFINPKHSIISSKYISPTCLHNRGSTEYGTNMKIILSLKAAILEMKEKCLARYYPNYQS